MRAWPPLNPRCSRSARRRPLSASPTSTAKLRAGRLRRGARAGGRVHLQPLPVRETHAQRVRSFRARLPAEGLAVVAICSNDTDAYPQDGRKAWPRKRAAPATRSLICSTRRRASRKAYDAACTPDLYLFDAQRKLVYRGQFDDSRPGRGTPTGSDLRAACDALLNGAAMSSKQKPSIGCNIKWKD